MGDSTIPEGVAGATRTVYDVSIGALDGAAIDLSSYRGKPMLIVNVASRCGLTPQYTGLQALSREYGPRGLVVLGVPCNQFGGQEPGTPAEIAEFCATTYGVDFPMTEKIEVNGAGRHPLYHVLTPVADADGHRGDIRWNFEKFLVDRDGSITRFGPTVAPEDPVLVSAVDRVVGA